MTTTLAQQIDKLVAERDAALARERALEDQVSRQRGGLLESRAQNKTLIDRNERLAAQVARLNKHMRDALGSAEDIVARGNELRPCPDGPACPDAALHPPTIKDRIASLVRRNGEAA